MTTLSSELADRLQAALGGSYTLERELGGGGMSRRSRQGDRLLRAPDRPVEHRGSRAPAHHSRRAWPHRTPQRRAL